MIISRTSGNGVGTSAACDGVVAGAADDGVCAIRANDAVVPSKGGSSNVQLVTTSKGRSINCDVLADVTYGAIDDFNRAAIGVEVVVEGNIKDRVISVEYQLLNFADQLANKVEGATRVKADGIGISATVDSFGCAELRVGGKVEEVIASTTTQGVAAPTTSEGVCPGAAGEGVVDGTTGEGVSSVSTGCGDSNGSA